MRPITFVQTIFPGLDSFDLSHRSVRMGAGRVLSGMAAGLLMISPVVAAETITYTYDAKGRLVKVKRTGTVNNNVIVDYVGTFADGREFDSSVARGEPATFPRSEENTSELQSLMRISYAVFCLKNKKT